MGRLDPFLIATAAFLAAYAVALAAFPERVPRSYAWSELVIADQGGYVRRDLLGHLAFLLDVVVGARPVLAGIVALGYVAVILSSVPAARRAGPWIGMLFVLSPATPLFRLLDPEAFGRKDAPILTTFALSLAAAGAGARAFGRGAALAAAAAAYAAANLVVVSGIVYAPTAVFAGRPPGAARHLHRDRHRHGAPGEPRGVCAAPRAERAEPLPRCAVQRGRDPRLPAAHRPRLARPPPRPPSRGGPQAAAGPRQPSPTSVDRTATSSGVRGSSPSVATSRSFRIRTGHSHR